MTAVKTMAAYSGPKILDFFPLVYNKKPDRVSSRVDNFILNLA